MITFNKMHYEKYSPIHQTISVIHQSDIKVLVPGRGYYCRQTHNRMLTNCELTMKNAANGDRCEE